MSLLYERVNCYPGYGRRLPIPFRFFTLHEGHIWQPSPLESSPSAAVIHASHKPVQHNDPAAAKRVLDAAKIFRITRKPVEVSHDHRINARFSYGGQDSQQSRAFQVESRLATVLNDFSKLFAGRLRERSDLCDLSIQSGPRTCL